MRLGFDVDGVLADWNADFIELVKRVTGVDLFGPGFVPRTWSYPQSAGYTSEQESLVWQQHIIPSRSFWMGLTPYPEAQEVLARIRLLALDHDVYFITSRPGMKAKHQTEVWLSVHSGDITWTPTVMIASDKAAVAKALSLTAYIDDRDSNVLNVAMQTTTQAYLMDQPWNHTLIAAEAVNLGAKRVASVTHMLDYVSCAVAK